MIDDDTIEEYEQLLLEKRNKEFEQFRQEYLWSSAFGEIPLKDVPDKDVEILSDYRFGGSFAAMFHKELEYRKKC